jgi:hypothetical protein
MYRAFFDDSEVEPMIATIPAFFAKFSLAWPALLTLFGNNDIRKKLNMPDDHYTRANISLTKTFVNKTSIFRNTFKSFFKF